MGVISSNDIKNGMTISAEGGLFTIVEFQHVKPGKGGAFVRTKLRNARTGAVIERTYRADERLDQAIIDKSDVSFLYRDGEDYIFMNTVTYDQIPVTAKALGDAVNFLKETGTAMLITHNDEIIGVEMPPSVELRIAETEPGIQGDRVSGARKPATLETGFVVQVPLFVGPDEVIKVDTRSGEYMTRA
ncbi:MAG: elongation factor P [Actinomycetota bacterium]|jgi:elongation factor P